MKNITISTPNDQAKRLLLIRHKRDQLREMLNQLDAEYDGLRDALLAETQKHNVLTLKTEEYTISRKVAKTPYLTDEKLAIKSLKARGLEPIMRLDTLAMKGTFLAAFRNDKPIKGTDLRVTEYISITQNKKEK